MYNSSSHLAESTLPMCCINVIYISLQESAHAASRRERGAAGRHRPELPCRTLIDPPPGRSLYTNYVYIVTSKRLLYTNYVYIVTSKRSG